MIEENNYQKDDEIDLRELFNTLLKRKGVLIAVTGVITLLVIVYAYVSKPVYEVKSVIELAQYSNSKVFVDDPKDLQQKLEFLYQVNVKGKKVEFPRVSEVSLPKGSSGILILKVLGYDNSSATSKLQSVISFVEESQNQKIKAFTSMQKKRIENLKSEIADIDRSIKKKLSIEKNYELKITNIESKDAALAAIYSIELGKQESDINEMKTRRSTLISDKNALELSISDVSIKSTKMVGDIEVLDHPVKPKKALIIIVAFISGVMLSIFIVFFMEFLSKGKSEE